MVLQYHMVATVQAAILEAQAGAFSVGEAREHGCETAAHTHPRVVENTLGSGGGGGGGGGLHRTAIGSVVVQSESGRVYRLGIDSRGWCSNRTGGEPVVADILELHDDRGSGSMVCSTHQITRFDGVMNDRHAALTITVMLHG
jgi:hypothetical protein